MFQAQRKLEKIRKLLWDFSLASGLPVGQKDYTKFIILGRGRSGSNWLRTLLASHDNVRVFGELFNLRALQENQISWGSARGYRTTPKLLELRATRPVNFVDDVVFAPMPSSIRAVGFKLFYYHARRPELQEIWDHLRSLDLRVIHLKRRNLLDSCLSMVVAADTGRYVEKAGNQNRDFRTYELDYQTCLRYFRATEEWYKEFEDYFPNTKTVFYEDMLMQCEKEMRGIQEFLGITDGKLVSSMKRQSRAPRSQVISNYAELKRRFSGSKYESYFNDTDPEVRRTDTTPHSA